MHEPVVVSPVPRDKWRSMLASDPGALPDHAPEWIDAITSSGRYRDASRLYSFADGREFLLPLVQRRGLAGLGGWLQSYPPGWGVGGLVGDGVDEEATRAILHDLRGLRRQRIAIRPDPQRWHAWEGALDSAVLTIPRRAHVIDLGGGAEAVWERFSKSARRGVRAAQRAEVHLESGHSGALLSEYYSLFILSVDRWADQQHEPRVLAHTRATARDPFGKLQSMAEHLGKDFVITLAYIDGKPAVGTITLFAGTAHDTRSAMDRDLVGTSGAGDLVQWTTLQQACERGCTTYHLGESGKSEALARFKEKFGARPYDYAELRLDRLPWTTFDSAVRAAVKRVLGFKDV